MATKRPYVDFKEVKEKVSIPDALKALGLLDQFTEKNGVYTGVCPIPTHQHGPSPNPSQFKFDNRRGEWLFKCFGDCNAGGDVIELVRQIKQYSHEHVRFWFADRFGERLSSSRGTVVKPFEKVVDEDAGEVRYEQQGEAKEALTPLRFYLNLDPDVPYLRERGIGADTIKRYGIGLCNKGVLRGYVAMPVYRYRKEAADENPVGYIGRWPGETFTDEQPRYKVPSGFQVSRVVYGLNEALDHRTAELPLIVVEGPFKVFALVQRGFPNTVSTCTASVSDDQAAILAATKRPIVLLFDGDEAGYQGMRQGAAKLITQTFVRVVKLPAGIEPDQLSQEHLDELLGFAKP